MWQLLDENRPLLRLLASLLGASEYLARALLALVRRDEALALLQPLLYARMRMLGAYHQRTRTARELLAKATSN